MKTNKRQNKGEILHCYKVFTRQSNIPYKQTKTPEIEGTPWESITNHNPSGSQSMSRNGSPGTGYDQHYPPNIHSQQAQYAPAIGQYSSSMPREDGSEGSYRPSYQQQGQEPHYDDRERYSSNGRREMQRSDTPPPQYEKYEQRGDQNGEYGNDQYGHDDSGYGSDGYAPQHVESYAPQQSYRAPSRPSTPAYESMPRPKPQAQSFYTPPRRGGRY